MTRTVGPGMASSTRWYPSKYCYQARGPNAAAYRLWRIVDSDKGVTPPTLQTRHGAIPATETLVEGSTSRDLPNLARRARPERIGNQEMVDGQSR